MSSEVINVCGLHMFGPLTLYQCLHAAVVHTATVCVNNVKSIHSQNFMQQSDMKMSTLPIEISLMCWQQEYLSQST
jgi:hypothetical protein